MKRKETISTDNKVAIARSLNKAIKNGNVSEITIKFGNDSSAEENYSATTEKKSLEEPEDPITNSPAEEISLSDYSISDVITDDTRLEEVMNYMRDNIDNYECDIDLFRGVVDDVFVPWGYPEFPLTKKSGTDNIRRSLSQIKDKAFEDEDNNNKEETTMSKKKFKPADRRYNGITRPYRRLSYNGCPRCLEPEMFPGIVPGQYITDAGEMIKFNETGPTIVRQDTSDSEYWVTTVYFFGKDGKPYPRTMKTHRLMGMVFMPVDGCTTEADYKGLEINHLDGDKANDSLDNLEWVTRSENMKHAYQTGLNGNDRLEHRRENIDKTKKKNK